MSWMSIHSVPSGFSTIGIPAEVNRKPHPPPPVRPADVSRDVDTGVRMALAVRRAAAYAFA
jgi:hypothetical protein